VTAPIGAIRPVFAPVTPTVGGADATTAGSGIATSGSSGEGFATQLSKGFDELQQSQWTADKLATKAASGDLTDVHDYMIASSEASLAMQLTVAVRNKALDAFNEIMRMQG
jgi:flagellar hook-basal body complex protein FliE